MLPPASAPHPLKSSAHGKKYEVFYISSSMYHPKSLPSKTLLLPDPLVSFSTAALLFFQFSSDTRKYIYQGRNRDLMFPSCLLLKVYTSAFQPVVYKTLGNHKKLLQVLWKTAKKPSKPLVIQAKLMPNTMFDNPAGKFLGRPQTVIAWKPLIDPMLPKINKNCIRDILRVIIDYRPNPSNTHQRQLVLEHARVI